MTEAKITGLSGWSAADRISRLVYLSADMHKKQTIDEPYGV